MTKLSHKGYSAGHPWYYFLGGAVPKLKDIKEAVYAGGYEGYLADDIKAIAKKPEPQRSRAIREMRQNLIDNLRRDISMYRRCVRKLRQHRATNTKAVEASCAEVHTSMSLKHNHIYNGFANLKTLDVLPEQQLDLFGG